MECSENDSKSRTKNSKEDVGDAQEVVTTSNGSNCRDYNELLASVLVDGEVCRNRDKGLVSNGMHCFAVHVHLSLQGPLTHINGHLVLASLQSLLVITPIGLQERGPPSSSHPDVKVLV